MKNIYQHIMRNSFFYMLLFIILPFYTMAQDDNAFAGKKGVFIYHGYEPASAKFPDTQGNTGFLLQRRDRSTGSPWATVKQFHSPQNAGELLDNYSQAMRVFPDNTSRFDAAAVWDKWKKYRSFDSLAYDLGYPPAQMAFGILVMDSTVTTGNTYQYRILKDKQPMPLTDNQVSNWVAYPAKTAMKAPKFYKRRTERDVIILEWYANAYSADNEFNVYRAVGNEKKFTLIKPGTFSMNRNDTLVYSMQDIKVSFGQVYKYYITPVNAFGGGGNVRSDTITATCVNAQQLLSPQFINAKPDERQKAIALHYMLPDPDYIGTVHIMRSTDFDSGFTEIGVNSQRDSVYMDYRITPGKKYYYYLQMTDKLGRNSARSIKTFGLYQSAGNESPARFVTAVRVKNGVQVTWRNPPDKAIISGFYVCRSEGKSGTFQRITTLLPVADSLNIYTDTSRLLKNNYMYAYSVVSENLSNKISQNSVIAYVVPNGAASPVKLMTPRNVKAIAENAFVRLLWYDMRLVNITQTSYNIYRRSDLDTVFRAVATNYPAAFTSFRDTTTMPGLRYAYMVEGTDGSGNKSASVLTNEVLIKDIPLYAPDISVFATKQGAVITWTQSGDKRLKQYEVYRYKKGEQPVKIGVAKNSDKKFEDTNAPEGKTYYYYILPEAKVGRVNVAASNKAYLVK